MRVLTSCFWVFVFGWILTATACQDAEKLRPRSLTWAELRTVRHAAFVTPPGESERRPYSKERLIDGTGVRIERGGLVWLRRDTGATYLVQGPAHFVSRAGSLEANTGRYFVDTPPGTTAELSTPHGPLHLADVRASLSIQAVDGGEETETDVYVLRGEVRTEKGRAAPGERLTLTGTGDAVAAVVAPELIWVDWTGGLATTDRTPAPAPFGVGTVGARPASATGAARTPLAIHSLDLNVKIDGDFAVTEVSQVFFNPSSIRLEGIYRFRTPAGASLQRFGVNRGDEIVWGRIKEKSAASAQYESNVYEGSGEDPALLEWESPGVYKARLYPIQPGESRRVVVRYTEWLHRTGERGERRLYVYPMAAEGAEATLPHIEEMRAVFDLGDAEALEVRSGMNGTRRGSELLIQVQDLVPRADLSVELFDGGSTQLRAYRAEHELDLETLSIEERASAEARADDEADYFMLPLRPQQLPTVEGGLDLVVVIDASAATDDSALAIARAATQGLLSHLGDGDRALVATGADGLSAVGTSKILTTVDEAGRADLLDALSVVRPGGATDLGKMLTEAARRLEPQRRGAVIYIGDGKATVGELTLQQLRERLAKESRPVRVFALGVGDEVDMAVLAGIENGGFAERLNDANAAARAALRVLERAEQPAALGLSVELGQGIERVFPRQMGALLADEGLIVVGRLSREAAAAPKTVLIAGPTGATEYPLVVEEIDDAGDLRNRWATARLRQMMDEDSGRAAMVDLGSRYGIVTPVTSFYVPTAREVAAAEKEVADTADQLVVIQDLEPEEDVPETEPTPDARVGRTGTQEMGEEAPTPAPAMRPRAPRKSTRTSYNPRLSKQEKADADNSRASALREARVFRMIEQMEAGDTPHAPVAPWGVDVATGDDAISADSNMWGEELRGAFGAGGLGMGVGSARGRLGGYSHRVRGPQLRTGDVTVSGRLPREVVRRIVRQNHGRFRQCYELGLERNPSLEGRIRIRFVIDREGSVTNVANAGGDLPDAEVVECMKRVFRRLSFPQPDGAIVTVVYPFTFSPDGSSRAPTRRPRVHTPTETAPPLPVRVQATRRRTTFVAQISRRPLHCSAAADLPLKERVILWRERLGLLGANPAGAANMYRKALRACEAPSWRARRRLFSMMLDTLPSVRSRVTLWRVLFNDLGAANAIYRGIVARVRTAEQMREFHAALGLRTIDSGLLEQVLKRARTPALRARTLRQLRAEWPNDFALALRLLDALEDAAQATEEEDGGALRQLAVQLRARPDATAAVRTAVGELHLRLAARAAMADDVEQEASDVAEAKRAFGEIVEFAPDDPVARRRLGDLLRAHGWYAEARRQYETLALLVPDDNSVAILIGAAAEGQGRLEEAVKWTERGGAGGDPTDATGPAATARALALTYLAWGRQEALKQGRTKELAALMARAKRLRSSAVGQGSEGPAATRVSLSWDHPEFHPTLWSNARGAPMPAAAGDVTLGISEVILAAHREGVVEVRVEDEAREHLSRLGVEAVLTVVFNEAEPTERIHRLPVKFASEGPSTLRFALQGSEVKHAN